MNIDGFVRDVRHALRGLRSSPTFAVTTVLILAVGTGMASAIFTVFEAVLLRPLPIQAADRVVVLRAYERGDVAVASARAEVDELGPCEGASSGVARGRGCGPRVRRASL